MNQDRLDRALTEALRQEQEQVSADFTARVLARLEQRPSRSLLLSRPALAAAAALALFALGATLGLGIRDGGSSAPQAAVEREQLLREYRELERELEQLRRLADESRPVLYLGGDETFDVMYDLREYEDRLDMGGVRPVSLPPDRG